MEQRELESMTDIEIYQRVFKWYSSSGLALLQEKNMDGDFYQRGRELIKALPEPENASPADIYFVFQMVSSDLLEWAFQESDEHGITMGAYARGALEKKEGEIGFDQLFDFLRSSSLFKEFSRFS